jgi:hypothetical protein
MECIAGSRPWAFLYAGESGACLGARAFIQLVSALKRENYLKLQARQQQDFVAAGLFIE